MKSKAPLLMMEQLIMVLVFALASALCLRCFALAGEISERTARRDEAVLIAQNAAERLKSGEAIGDEWQEQGYQVSCTETQASAEGLRQADIEVRCEDEQLFVLTVGWTEDVR